MMIDCDRCVVRDLACHDCVVGVVLAAAPPTATGGPPLELDGPERAAIAVLARAGMVPPLRLVPMHSGEAQPVGDAAHGCARGVDARSA